MIGAQGSQLGEANATIGATVMESRTASSKFFPVSREFLADAAINVEAEVRRMLRRRLGRAITRKITEGDAAMAIPGLKNIGSIDVKTGSATTLPVANWDRIVDLSLALDSAYDGGEEGFLGINRTPAMGMIGFMVHKSLLRIIAKLQDSDKRPLWIAPSIRSNLPGAIFGWPYTENAYLDTVGANKFPGIFGNFEYYVLTDLLSRS